MERANRRKDAQLVKNQPGDESLEVDGEEVTSLHSPTPRRHPQSEAHRKTHSLLSANSSSDEFKDHHRPQRPTEPGPGPNQDEEEEEDSDEEDTDDDDDDDEPTESLEGAYNPADYAHLPVSTEIKELFQYITRKQGTGSGLESDSKPVSLPRSGVFEMLIMCVQVPRPDGKPDELGLMVLDEPSVKQSNPQVLSLWLSEESKQHQVTQHMKTVTSVARPQLHPRAVDSWVDSIGALHRSKPPASVQYSRPVPDIDSLMQEWPAELEELLGRLQLPSARLACSLSQYVDIVCCLLDIPIYSSRIQSLHLLLSLYLEFRDSQHFTRRA
ncbi:intraflagellar transport protein 46-like protein [Nothobranchius furzeri]|uniref:Intraflagellar transport protein 46 homolog n=1 Tax=Nothobranchius furzeri TaxID=105023 RepID=A0A9D2Z4T5_NOTFU|nr:intraflagellar transport protein 46-like protein [Nothobranchius furzeri]